MRKIDDIIRSALLTGEGVYLPWVGTLVPISRHAVIDGQRISAPQRDVRLDPEEVEGSYSIIDYILKDKAIERGKADRLYGRWFEESTSGGILLIERVGRIAGGRLQLDAGFMTELNPGITGGIRLPKRRKHGTAWIWWVSGAAACILAAALCYKTFLPTGDTPVAETALKTTVKPAAAGRPQQDTGQTAKPHTDGKQQVGQTNPVTTDTTSKPDTPGTRPAAPAADRYYVVLGVFTDAANADKMTDKILKAKGDLEVNIETLPYGGKTMVTIYSGEDEREVTVQMRLLRSLHPDVWIYRRKAGR